MIYLVHTMVYFIKSCFHFCFADKAAACATLTAAFNAQPNNRTLLDCNVECCIGDNCNNQSVTVIPPTTPTNTSTTPPVSSGPTTPAHTTPSGMNLTSDKVTVKLASCAGVPWARHAFLPHARMLKRTAPSVLEVSPAPAVRA